MVNHHHLLNSLASALINTMNYVTQSKTLALTNSKVLLAYFCTCCLIVQCIRLKHVIIQMIFSLRFTIITDIVIAVDQFTYRGWLNRSWRALSVCWHFLVCIWYFGLDIFATLAGSQCQPSLNLHAGLSRVRGGYSIHRLWWQLYQQNKVKTDICKSHTHISHPL